MDDPRKILLALARFRNNPWGFVRFAFPWGKGVLEGRQPEQWQDDLLRSLGTGLLTPEEAIRQATVSGNGVGKSALVSWIILWAMSTYEDCKGVVTANTETQLKTKTWAELGKWFHLFVAKEFFSLGATTLTSRDPDHERTWRVDMVPWSEHNVVAFQGLPNEGKLLFMIFDEASAIADGIWEAADGCMTDKGTQRIWCVFGNPNLPTGRFRECFKGGRFESRWVSRSVDSRTVSFTDKGEFERWISDYGEDSDFVRIRVRGVFPRSGEQQFISVEDVDAAMSRDPVCNSTDPLAVGVDVARYGSNESVIYFRKGRDGSTIPLQSFRGINTVELATRVHQAHLEYNSDGIFVDGGGVGGGVVDNVRNMQLYCFDVNFGGKDDVGGRAQGNSGERYANKRAAMWGALRAWLKNGALPRDPDLRNQLLGPKYLYNQRGEIQLESKEDMLKRGVDSPDRADALALTFAYPLAPSLSAGGYGPRQPPVETEYDPFEEKRMIA